MDNYQNLVNEAKKHIQEIECHQAKIAKLALQACEIVRGKGLSSAEERYTLADFASDVGVNKNTLNNWVKIYKNIMAPVGIADPSPAEWSAGDKTHKTILQMNSMENSENGTPFKQTYPDNDSIKELFGQIKSGNKRAEQVYRLYSYAKTIAKRLDNSELSYFDENTLLRIMEQLDYSSDLINDYLTENKKTVREAI